MRQPPEKRSCTARHLGGDDGANLLRAVRGGVAVISRRTFLASGAAVLAAPLAAKAQQRDQIARVGYLSPGSSSDAARLRRFEAFRQGLRELGYVEGQNIAIEPRWAEGNYDRYGALATDLVRLKVDVIVVVGGAATRAAQQATGTIPIVMSVVNDPVGGGLVPSLAHPGRNVTGLTIMTSDLVGKQLGLLKELLPRVSRVVLLGNPANPGTAPQLREAEDAARALRLRLQILEARVPREIDYAFAAMTRERPGALLTLDDAIFTNQVRQIAELAAKQRLPAIYGTREYTEAGGLIAYGANRLDRAASSHLRGQDPQGRQVGRPPRRAAHEVRVGHQSEDRQSPRLYHPALAAAAGGSGD